MIYSLDQLLFDNKKILNFHSREESWMKLLLEEISHHPLPPGNDPLRPVLTFSGSLTLTQHSFFNENLIVEGELSIQFYDQCTRTGDIFLNSMNIMIDAIFIKDHPDYRELTELEVQGKCYELYFFKKNKVDLCPLLREFLYMNKDPYPKI